MNLFGKKIYMDYAATTPVLPEVRRAMERYWSRDFYNPSSIYEAGARMKRELDSYRARVAELVGAGKKDVIFTSGGTESDDLAILGAFEAFREENPGKHGHLIISAIEHPAVMEAAAEVSKRGGEVSVAGVDENGLVNPKEILRLVREDTFLISIMLANNEIGTIQPVHKIARALKGKNIFLHTDASQAPSYLDVSVSRLGAGLLSLDGSKIYGPKSVGILVVRPNVRLRPILLGGGQERGLRSGTENLALIAGFTKALEVAVRDREKENKRLSALQKYFIESIERNIPDAVINTPIGDALPNIVSVSMPGALSELLLLALDRAGVEVSVGSACGSNLDRSGSYVIRAINRPELAESTLRFSFGRFTTKKEVDRALKLL